MRRAARQTASRGRGNRATPPRPPPARAPSPTRARRGRAAAAPPEGPTASPRRCIVIVGPTVRRPPPPASRAGARPPPPPPPPPPRRPGRGRRPAPPRRSIGGRRSRPSFERRAAFFADLLALVWLRRTEPHECLAVGEEREARARDGGVGGLRHRRPVPEHGDLALLLAENRLEQRGEEREEAPCGSGCERPAHRYESATMIT